MRDKLNENPAVQAGVVLVLIIVFAFIFFTRIMGGEEAPPATDATVTPVATDATVDPAATTEPGAVEPTPSTAPAVEAAAAAAPADFEAGPGLPQDVVSAYEDGKTVVVLITRAKGIDDRRIADDVNRLRSQGDVAVFTTVAKGIARYSRITRGVNVERTPALVVVRPQKRSDDGQPLATVSYGFRGPESIQQTVRDALYEGRSDIPYYPE